MPHRDLALPVDLTREYVIGKCDYFASIGIWPSKVVLDPERWLTNFFDDEVEHALYLLNAFMYYESALVDQIFSTAIRTIARCMTQDQWKEFLDNLMITIVTGEEPKVTDSGHLFARKARSLGIPEGRRRVIGFWRRCGHGCKRSNKDSAGCVSAPCRCFDAV